MSNTMIRATTEALLSLYVECERKGYVASRRNIRQLLAERGVAVPLCEIDRA